MMFSERTIAKIIGGKSRQVTQRAFTGTPEQYDAFCDSRSDCPPTRWLKGSSVEIAGRLEHKTYEFLAEGGDILYYT